MAKRFTDRDLAIFRNQMGENIPIPKERKKPSREESIAQCSVIRWWAAMHKTFNVPEPLLFAVPNVQKHGVVAAMMMKREGLRAGVCDLMLAVPRPGTPGLFVEMKRKGGILSDDQKAFIAAVRAQGYEVRVCFSFDEAVKAITDYLA